MGLLPLAMEDKSPLLLGIFWEPPIALVGGPLTVELSVFFG